MTLNMWFNGLLWAQFISGAGTFILLYFLSAPYGRHSRKGWGPAISAKLGWVLMEFPAFFVILLFYFMSSDKTNPVLVVFILIWELHYVQRTFVYPMMMSKKSKQMPVMIILFSLIFNSMNGFVNGYYLFASGIHTYTTSWFLDPRFIIGLLIFLCGFAINLQSDYILRHLRKPGESGYKIPNKGLFKYVASPNYLGEIMEWVGWAVLTWSIAGLAFAFFTAANLAPRAYTNLKWYRKTFGDEYPKNRKALIPFIY